MAAGRKELPFPHSAESAGQGFLVDHRLRQLDARDSAKWSESCEQEFLRQEHPKQQRWVDRYLLRPRAACGEGKQLDSHSSRQGMVLDLPSLRAASALVRP